MASRQGEGTSRRALLKGATLAAGAVAAPAVAAEGGAAAPVDVIVVGAGMSGLCAARALRSQGRSVLVLEARDRVGGRTKPGAIAGVKIDLGGMWVGPTQTRLLALGEEFGLQRYPSFIEGKNITEIGGVMRNGSRDTPGVALSSLPEFLGLVSKIGGLSRTVPLEAPWTAPDAARLDSMTLATWVEQNVRSPALRTVMESISSSIMAADMSQTSMLYFLFYCHSGDDLVTLAGMGSGAQKWLYRGGLNQVGARIAAELGEAVRLNAPVRRIAQDAAGVVVTSDAGAFRARRVIVAVPPALAARIDYAPGLPALRDGLCQRLPMGSTIKFWIAYPRPFWRDAGLNGLVLSDRTPVGLYTDVSPDAAGPGLIAGFFEGSHAVAWGQRTAAERKAQIVGDLTRLLGPQAAQPIDYVDNDWPSEEWSRGCYVGVAGPGVISVFGEALRRPVGRIHWAGTETSTVWCGYVEGAIRAGERAAAEAHAALAA
ncbi:flavin monoamine oxidase family protein [Phenylobacterium montanum]|uniref:Flavin monoamine oxidase family protein n=1 Tax=Phenylobacterium montanum TaxID=2823693 RepID=A0A975IV15_9CAUL|nr:flavin monoamine oxidase family protein [Caulobacter sp. S6]QUD86836.1 flavin monoamine oxidase family protein [Caulobacter sp. S6]